jgi:flagellar biosynthesis GTPase FlhF
MQEDSVRLAILEKNQENSEKDLVALREAISEISKVNVRISELLAVHQVKLEQQRQKEEEINRKVETGITKLTQKMDADRAEIYEKLETDKKSVLEAVDTVRKEFDVTKSRVLIGVGILLALQSVITLFGPTFVSNMTTKMVLTTPPPHATIKAP